MQEIGRVGTRNFNKGQVGKRCDKALWIVHKDYSSPQETQEITAFMIAGFQDSCRDTRVTPLRLSASRVQMLPGLNFRSNEKTQNPRDRKSTRLNSSQ